MHNIMIVNRHLADLNPVQLGTQSCPPGHSFGPTVRTHWLLHYVEAGCGTFTRDGKTHFVKAGDIFVIPPFVKTFYKADKTTPWKYTWVGFKADIKLPEILEQPVIRLGGAGEIFKGMLFCEHLESGRTAQLAGKLWELFSLMYEKTAARLSYVKKAKTIMNVGYINGIAVADVAEELNLDRSYFSTLFKKETGVSPQQYLMELRLRRAAELMKTHRQPPAVAALSVGYSDIYQFSKIFKKHYGVPPREYAAED